MTFPPFYLDPIALSFLITTVFGFTGMFSIIFYSNRTALSNTLVLFTGLAGLLAFTLFLERGLKWNGAVWPSDVSQARLVVLFWVFCINVIWVYRFPLTTPEFVREENPVFGFVIGLGTVHTCVWMFESFSAETARTVWLAASGLHLLLTTFAVSIAIRRYRHHKAQGHLEHLAALRGLTIVNILCVVLACGDIVSVMNNGLITPLAMFNSLAFLIASIGIAILYMQYSGATVPFLSIVTILSVGLGGLLIASFGFLLTHRLETLYLNEQITMSQRSYIDYHLRPLAWITMSMLLFAFTGMPIALRKWLLTPLEALLHGVERIESGQLDARLPTLYDDEIGMLSVAFNRMAAAVEYSQKSLQEANALLESRVSERTQQLALEKERAEVANKAKTAFLATMSHELRTPLNAILGHAQILRNRSVEPDAVTAIEQSGMHLALLVEDALDTAKIEAGQVDLNPSEVNLVQFFAQLTTVARLTLERSDLRFNACVNPDLPDRMMFDEKRLRQVLLNLLSNAGKFTQSGSVSLRVTPVASDLNGAMLTRFEVVDTGIGIPQADLHSIFEPFTRVHNGIKAEGSGLGLSISAELVQLMNSTLCVESEVGVGSRFWFDVPLVPLSSKQLGMTTAHSAESDPSHHAIHHASKMLLPTHAELQQLLLKAQQGDVVALNQAADVLLTNSAEMQSFVENLRQYTQNYQIEQLCIWLEQLCGNTATQQS